MGIEGKKNILGSREHLVNPTVEGTILGPITGCLGATCYVVANDTKGEVKAHAQALHDASYPVWVCDGIDDQVEIQAAINALPVGGGKVLLMEGTFVTNPSVSISMRAGVSLEGVGWSTILKPAAEALVPLVDMNNNTTLRNLTIDMVFYRENAVRASFISNILIEGTRLLNGYTIIALLTVSQARIINNYIKFEAQPAHALGDAIGPNTAPRLVVMGNTIDQTGTEGQGIDIQSTSFSVVTGNTIKGGVRAIEWHSTVLEQGNIISNNVIEGTSQAAIRIKNNRGFVVSGNTIVNPEGHGIISMSIDKPVFDGIITDNSILSSDSMYELIHLGNASERVKITNNHLRNIAPGMGPQGINIGEAAIDTQVTGNTLSGFTSDRGYMNFSPSTFDSQQFVEVFMDVLLRTNDHIHPEINPDGLVHTDVASPDVPRNTALRIKNTDTVNAQTPSGGNMIIEGKDARSRTITETLVVPASAIPAGTSRWIIGSRAFATISQVTYYSETNTTIAVAVGTHDRLGLSNTIIRTGDVFKVKRGTADVPVGSVDVANGTVSMTTITGGDDFTVYYRNNLNILA